MTLNYVKPERVFLRNHPEISEKWLQDRIADDPSILGLGDLILKDRERVHPKAGRLDLLLQDVETNRRYEVEIQLGATDESHIIRTLEYWDIEHKRYPQYEHTAVIVAEDITSRFLNVISLFNGFIPLIALQLNAFKIGESVSLVFTKVLDEMRLGLVEEDEEVQAIADRSYWESRAGRNTLNMTDDLFTKLKAADPQLELKYNKFYIGLAKNGEPTNFVIFRPKREWLRVEPRMEKTDEMDARLDEAGLDVMDYDARWGRYRIRVTRNDFKKHEELLRELLLKARENAMA
jgi:hypothetical protein